MAESNHISITRPRTMVFRAAGPNNRIRRAREPAGRPTMKRPTAGRADRGRGEAEKRMEKHTDVKPTRPWRTETERMGKGRS